MEARTNAYKIPQRHWLLLQNGRSFDEISLKTSGHSSSYNVIYKTYSCVLFLIVHVSSSDYRKPKHTLCEQNLPSQELATAAKYYDRENIKTSIEQCRFSEGRSLPHSTA